MLTRPHPALPNPLRPWLGSLILIVLAGGVAGGQQPVPIPDSTLTALSFEGRGASIAVTFTHHLKIAKDQRISIPLFIEASQKDALFRSLVVQDAGQLSQQYSFVLAEEEFEQIAAKQFPQVFDGDDFAIEAFRKLLLGSKVTLVVQRDGMSANFSAELDRSNQNKPSLSAALSAPAKATVQITGTLLGISSDGSSLKMLVPVAGRQAVVTIQSEAVVSTQFDGNLFLDLQHALDHLQARVSRPKQLIVTAKAPIDAELSYKYPLPDAYEIETIGELADDNQKLNLKGWITLRNATPFDWTDVALTIVTPDKQDADYKLGNTTLAKGQVARVPLPFPGGQANLAASPKLVVDAPEGDGRANLAARLSVVLASHPTLSILSDRLLIWKKSKLLVSDDDFGELPTNSPSGKPIVLAESKAIKVSVERFGEIPLAVVGSSKSDGYKLECQLGRVTQYQIRYTNDPATNGLPIEFVLPKDASHHIIAKPGEYSFVGNVARMIGRRAILEVIESPVTPATTTLAISDMATGFQVNGLQWMAQFSDPTFVKETLGKVIAIRAAQETLRAELELLESQLAVLETRQQDYLAQPQSSIHAAIVRHLVDRIYEQQLHIADKRAALAREAYQLDKIASGAMNRP